MNRSTLPARIQVAIACTALGGCFYPVTSAQCAADADCPGGFCSGGGCHPGTRSCPSLAPRFSSINDQLFQVGCGVTSSGNIISSNCHGADLVAGGSNLDLSPAKAYANLVGIRACDTASALDAGTAAELSSCSDAGSGMVERRDDCGVPAAPGDLARVRAGDPARSFLFIKLQMTSTVGACGSGMPPDHPGLYSCPEVLDAVARWISQGAQNN